MQILNFFITALVNTGIAFLWFFFLIIGLNGYSEKQATPGLILYIVWALFFSLLAAVLSVLTAKYLIGKKSFGSISAVAIASLVFIIAGGIANFIGMFAAAAVIESLR
ncbi:MAG: hypothetical protein ABWZ66_13275 [Pyrinomonadaceae bacterium]